MVTQLLVARGMPKATQRDARYTPAGGRERCGACRHFMAPSVCNRILGPVTAAGWCRYYSQQPPRRAANFPGMGPPGKSLDLSFMTPGTLDPRITFTRASTATYFDTTGTMQTAAANTPRWDYDPVSHALRGLLIEEARTNVVLQSADASNAAWIKQSFNGIAVPVVAANQAVAPDGTTTAASVAFPAVPSLLGNAWRVTQSITVTANPYSFSVWLRGAVGGEQVYVVITNGITIYNTPVTLTTAWQRYSVTSPALTAAAWAAEVAVDMRVGSLPATAAGTLYMWGGQWEQGAFPTSYIPTTAAAVTRATDSCTIPPANMGFFVPPGGSWFAEFIGFNPTVPTSIRVVAKIGLTPTIAPLYVTPSQLLGQYDGTTLTTVNATTANNVLKGASTWAVGAAKICLNAGAVASSAALASGYNIAASGVFFMANTTSPAETMSGYMRRVSYWQRVLTNAEMQQVTT